MILFLMVAPAVLVAWAIYGTLGSPALWDLPRFTSYLAATVRRNLPLGSSLAAFANDMGTVIPRGRRAILEIADATDNGTPLAEAMSRHKIFFPPAYLALVRAGERSGSLATAVGRLKEIAELRARAVRRALSYVLYPVAMLVTIGIAVWFITANVVPMFTRMFADLGEDTPTGLALLGRVGGFIINYWPILAMAAIAAFTVRGTGALARAGSLAPSGLGWYMWPLKRYERRRAVSQYALVAGRLLEAGVAETEALEIAAGSSGNACMDRIALVAAERVKEGARLSDALRAADPRGELPGEFAWYVEVGEASGRLPEALVAASESAAERSRSALGGLVRLIAPAGVIACACLVGLLGYAVFETLVTMMEAF